MEFSLQQAVARMTLVGVLMLVVSAPAEKHEAAATAASRVTQIIAHRGASLERPECTLASIHRAIEVGATAVEVDVRTSKDGHLFILHDATLDRTTNGTGPASGLTLEDLGKLDAGSWFDERYRAERIPSLIEAAQTSKGKIDLLLDLKEQGDGYDQQVAAVILKHGDPARTIVGVRSVAQAKRFRQLLPKATQLALIPSVAEIEAFADSGVDFIRLWPRWLADDDVPVKRVRSTGKRLHLNGASGGFNETLDLLQHQPDSLSSDNPRFQRAVLQRIGAKDLPVQLDELVQIEDTIRIQRSEVALGDQTFLNRDYKILDIPYGLEGLPRFAFDGGSGANIAVKFEKPAVVFAVFDYNKSGAWSFPDSLPASEHGWHLLAEHAYRGLSNDAESKPANIWFREFAADRELVGLPKWWICLGIADLETARGIEGFEEGLVSVSPSTKTRHSHQASAGRVRPLNIPEFDSSEAIHEWQSKMRKQFIERMVFPYQGEVTGDIVKSTQHEGFRQEEIHVLLEENRLFRYFKLTPENRGEDSEQLPTVVCFMGHGKVAQILEEADSYQHACAAEFARAGYLVYAMENVGMEPGPDTHHDLDRALRLEGHGWYSLLFAHQRILLDHVFENPAVDPDRVGVAGVSTGGLLALSAAAMDPRVDAASVQGIFGSMRVSFIRDRNSHCGCGAIPNLLPDFDLPELSLLIAPRPLHVSNGQSDGFPPLEAERCLKLIEPIFRQAGGKNPVFTTPPGGHAFALEPAMAFFGEHIK